MLRMALESGSRENKLVSLQSELVVVGGGMAGVCCAINAARSGIKVCLVQDRPVLGGCASSEIRVWILGATSHLGNNNRWSREGGIIDELLIENLYKNKEGNTVIFDTILLDKVKAEKNITLLLNTAVYDATKSSANKIKSVKAFCSQNGTEYSIEAPLFCDASGDGILGFMSGAPFVIGAESKNEFDEKMAPDEEQTELLGHTLFFYSKDVGKPVDFIPPEYAKNTKISEERLSRVNKGEDGIRLWWIEYGGTEDTIHGTEEIKWALWSVVYMIWDHIKNSGKFDGVENLSLEWVGTIPGKRESRRFIGHKMLTQKDIVEQKSHEDAISYGGWAIDLHPSGGVFSDESPCEQYHAKGIYQIPLGCFISQGIDNLFIAGRIISASHIAFGSTRVMATSAHGGQAVGTAAALCIKDNLLPQDLLVQPSLGKLQQELNEGGHFIPHIPLAASSNIASSAEISASSELPLTHIKSNGEFKPLVISAAQLLPLAANVKYTFTINVKAKCNTTLVSQLRVSDKQENYTPNVTLAEKEITLTEGEHRVTLHFDATLLDSHYAFMCLLKNENIEVEYSNERITGVVSVFNGTNKAVSNNGKQTVDKDLGVDEFEFWIPERRPGGKNLALEITPAIKDFSAANIINGYTRPWFSSNAWVADIADSTPTLTLNWAEEKEINSVVIHFDSDFDHPLESSLMGHPEKRIPFCVANYKILKEDGTLLHEVIGNYQTVNKITFEQPISTQKLIFQFEKTEVDVPVSVFSVIVS
ncbi:FAD-dependent oxidoreductase [Pseudocolwellia agarivorans]|uniref:FAD-dependent oxidoreductase n=1 Tax=Pseudocolwellia agarivorans TaxID=1911682 RepID=UPI000986BCC5|nr:FAD-dependent oxidoreductase [Pseudocolwellia agarivorans]